MTSRIVAAFLAVTVAACSSVPRIGTTQPANPTGAATAPSTSTKEDKASDSGREQKSEERPQEKQAQTPPEPSHLKEIGKGIVMVALIALLAWLQYRSVCPYSYC